jgi:DnaJ-class molecular chaperone
LNNYKPEACQHERFVILRGIMRKYEELDKKMSLEIKKGLKADGIDKYPVECQRCKGSGYDSYSEMAGIHEPCPECHGNGEYELAV